MSSDPRFNLGLQALQAGNWAAAIVQFQILTQARSGDREAQFYLGIALLSAGRPAEALVPLERLARKEERSPAVLNAYGSALAGSGQRGKAAQVFRRALTLAPTMAEASENLARVLLDDGKADETLPVLQALAEREPERLGVWLLLGNAQAACGDGDAAVASYETMLAKAPGHPAALNALGLLFYAAGLGEKALDCFERILKASPNDPIAACNRGLALAALDRKEAAEAQYRAVLARYPDLPQVNMNLGKLLSRNDRAAEAIPFLDRVDSFEARWWSALALPLMYRDEEDRRHWRSRYLSGLARLKVEFDGLPPSALAQQAGVLEKENFYLPYQAEDDRDPQAVLGAMQAAIAQARHGSFIAAPPARREGRVKVGFVSAFLRSHTVAKLFTGWMTGLDRERFEVFAFYVDKTWDKTTIDIQNGVEHFISLNVPFGEAVATVSGTGLDVLIYLDVGMAAPVDTLAALRLAPVQCVAVGHPETTGLPTIDHFLSGELIEPEDGASHYTENLVRLPGVGFNFLRPPLEQAILPELDPADTRPRFFCAQSVWKLLPRFDSLFARIAEETGPCAMWFCAWSDAFAEPLRRRLDAAFAARGLKAEDYVTVHPRMRPEHFLGLMRAADVSLDSCEWSGGNTTMEALACGTPVVTLPGRFMRGRVSAGILARAGLAGDLVAADGDDYVAKAVRLARDKALRQRISQGLLAAAPAVFDDRAGIDGLGAFLERVVRH